MSVPNAQMLQQGPLQPNAGAQMPQVASPIDLTASPAAKRARKRKISGDGFSKPKASELLPEYLKSEQDRKSLCQRIQELVSAHETEFGELKDRIARLEDFFDNRVVSTGQKPWKNAPEFQIPLVKPRVLQRKAALVNAILGSDPVFRYKAVGDQKPVKLVERLVKFFLEACDFSDGVDKAILRSMVSVFSVMRIMWHEDEAGYHGSPISGAYTGLACDLIHPLRFVAYPLYAGDLWQCRIHGHRYLTMEDEVLYLQKEGLYLDDQPETLGGDAVDQKDARSSSLTNLTATTSHQGDNMVELHDLIMRYFVPSKDGKRMEEKRIRVICRLSTLNILYVKEFEDPMSPYVLIQCDADERQLHSESSVSNDLQGLQIALNSFINQFYWGNMFASRPPILAEGMSLPKSIGGYAPGQVIPTRSIGKSMQLGTPVNMQAFPLVINLVQQLADSASKVSDTLTGGTPGKPETATAENIKMQGFQMSSNDDMRQVREAFRKIGKLVIYNLRKYYNNWSDRYGNMDIEPQMLDAPMLVGLGGDDIESNPALQIQQSQLVLALFQNMPVIIQAAVQVNPALALMVYDVASVVVMNTGLPNKIDLVSMLEEAKQLQEQMIQQQQQQAQQAQQMQMQQAQAQQALAQGQAQNQAAQAVKHHAQAQQAMQQQPPSSPQQGQAQGQSPADIQSQLDQLHTQLGIQAMQNSQMGKQG